MGFWSGEKVLQRVPREKLVVPFNASAIDCAAYTLTLGEHAFTTADDKDREASAKAGETPGVQRLQPAESFSIRPGQFAFLLTEEIVTIPNDAIGFISVKARRKFEGLINVSGFHVDPGWSSRLIFGVFNAGPHELVLERGEQLFLLFFADLAPADESEVNAVGSKYTYPDKNRYDHIPSVMIQSMSGPVPSLYKLDKVTKGLDIRIGELGSRSFMATATAGLALAISLAMFAKVVIFSGPIVTGTSAPNQTDARANLEKQPPTNSAAKTERAVSLQKQPALPVVPVPRDGTTPIPEKHP